MFGLHIGWRSEGEERLRRKWRRCQGLICSALGRQRQEWHQLYHRRKEVYWAWPRFPLSYSFVPAQPLHALSSPCFSFTTDIVYISVSFVLCICLYCPFHMKCCSPIFMPVQNPKIFRIQLMTPPVPQSLPITTSLLWIPLLLESSTFIKNMGFNLAKPVFESQS